MKQENLNLVLQYAKGPTPPEMYGSKLQALYRLIQKSGVEVEAADPDQQKIKVGDKALPLPGGQFLVMQHTPVSTGFFPCKMFSFLLG